MSSRDSVAFVRRGHNTQNTNERTNDRDGDGARPGPHVHFRGLCLHVTAWMRRRLSILCSVLR